LLHNSSQAFLYSCSLYRLPILFSNLTQGVASGLLQLSGFQPENLYTRFHWPERPKLQQPVGQRPGLLGKNHLGSLKGCRIMQQGRAKVLFSFHIFVRVKAKQDFSTPNASRM